jgi:hypothetical protein
MSTKAPLNSTKKISGWESLAGGRVVMLLPYTTYGEQASSEGSISTKPKFEPTEESIARMDSEDHTSLFIYPENVAFMYNQAQQYAQQNDISMVFKSIPQNLNYQDYVSQVREACQGKQSGSFDVLWLDATAPGILGDCLVNLWDWASDISVGQNPHILANNIYKNGLGKLFTSCPSNLKSWVANWYIYF